jgi:hypothetical protein
MDDKPDCYKCVHYRTIPGDRHIMCNNHEAKVQGNRHGIIKGWFRWPYCFDPVWLISCDSFSHNPQDNKTETEPDPVVFLLSMLR